MSSFDGVGAEEWARRLGVPRVVALEVTESTQDVAHALAADGAPAGTVVVADAQSAGRGRMGRAWVSEPGAGVWVTVIERPRDPAALEVLSLRVGLSLAPVLDAFADAPVQLKWPNDLYVGARKLAGVLIEARWREGGPDWVAIGVGVNVRVPAGEPRATGLRAGVARASVFEAVVPAIRAAASRTGPLNAYELHAFAERDLAVGRRCVSPVDGRVAGIDASGALRVDLGSSVVAVRAGPLVFPEER